MSFEKGECDAGDPDQTNRLPRPVEIQTQDHSVDEEKEDAM